MQDRGDVDRGSVRDVLDDLLVQAAGDGVAPIGGLEAKCLGSAQPELGPSFLMPVLAAAFLGATTIRPGRYNALGTAVAVYVVAVIVTGLQQIGVPFWAESIVYGTALATGVGLSGRLTRMREEESRRNQLRAIKEGRS